MNPLIPAKDPRLLVPFAFTVLPAIPIFLGAVYLIGSGGVFIAHPLAPLWFVVGLLLVALPIRLANYIYALRESSPTRKKVWAAIQCAVPASGVFLVGLAIADQGFTVGGLCLLSFFGCYLVALIALLLQVVHDYKDKEKRPNQSVQPTPGTVTPRAKESQSK